MISQTAARIAKGVLSRWRLIRRCLDAHWGNVGAISRPAMDAIWTLGCEDRRTVPQYDSSTRVVVWRHTRRTACVGTTGMRSIHIDITWTQHRHSTHTDTVHTHTHTDMLTHICTCSALHLAMLCCGLSLAKVFARASTPAILPGLALHYSLERGQRQHFQGYSPASPAPTSHFPFNIAASRPPLSAFCRLALLFASVAAAPSRAL
jgi:hypothetical protein